MARGLGCPSFDLYNSAQVEKNAKLFPAALVLPYLNLQVNLAAALVLENTGALPFGIECVSRAAFSVCSHAW